MKGNQKYDIKKYIEDFKAAKNKDEFILKVREEQGCSYQYAKKTLYETIRKDKAKKEKPEQEIKNNTAELISADRQVNKLKYQAAEADNKYKHLLKDYELLEKRYDTLIDIKQPVEVEIIAPKETDKTKNHATPIILLSDWHFEEKVEADTINGLNEYNLDIAQKRFVTCIQNSLRLVNIDRNHSQINNVVIWLGGDFITGYIHEELIENNYLSPTQATRFAKKMIITAIEFYLNHGKFDKISVVCNWGNHGRTTIKQRIGTGYKNSYEWMMYHDIADYFKNSVTFKIPDGFFAYFPVYDYTCRFWHGDSMKYQGGIGGLTVPLIKAIMDLNQQIKADYDFIGHWHTYFQATRRCIVNGSGIGYNAYAQRIRAAYEIPLQSYCLIDSRRGMTIKAPIFCE